MITQFERASRRSIVLALAAMLALAVVTLTDAQDATTVDQPTAQSDTRASTTEVPDERLAKRAAADRPEHIPETSIINEDGRIEDKIDLPFVNDPQVIGTWKSVDFVGKPEEFAPGEKRWRGDLYLKKLVILPKGRTTGVWNWTKGLVLHPGDRTASGYTLTKRDGATFMFWEWKSGDYTIRHRAPKYYVLKKESSDTGGVGESWAAQPSDTEFRQAFPTKYAKLDIDTADLARVVGLFGQPGQYVWGRETFTKDNLPSRFIMRYPDKFDVFIGNDRIVELRYYKPGYYLHHEIQVGSTLDDVLAVIGEPSETMEGMKNGFKDRVLYKDIDGRKGHCYYARADKGVRMFFTDYKINALYETGNSQ